MKDEVQWHLLDTAEPLERQPQVGEPLPQTSGKRCSTNRRGRTQWRSPYQRIGACLTTSRQATVFGGAERRRLPASR